MNNNTAKPFVKWVGGKGQLIDRIAKHLPIGFNQKKRKNIIRGNEVSDLYEWSLGGYKQMVLVEGKTKQLPILITLHGGPGTPVPFSVGCRGLFPEFTERFIMVYWDQLGCGCNNFVITDSFTIDSFVQMTMDLVYEIKKLFPKNKIYLFATSWGSILSAKLLEKESHIVDGVAVYGQIVRDIFFNDETITALEKSKLPKRKLAVIKAAKKESATNKELQLFSASIRKYTSGYQNKGGGDTGSDSRNYKRTAYKPRLQNKRF